MQSLRVSEPHDQVTSRAKLRLEAEAEMDWLYAFASADAEKNWIIDTETEIELHELWLEHAVTAGTRVSAARSSSGARPTGCRSRTSFRRPTTPNP
jgi:hypothetical protein